MTEIKQYLVEEVVIDHADGHISRREALHRLTLMGLGAAAAGGLLAACGGENAAGAGAVGAPAASGAPAATGTATSSAAASSPGSASAPGAATALPTEAVTFPGPEGRTLQGTWAAAPKPRGAVLVIHENRGLTDHFRAFPGRFAGVGYSALAIDLLSEEGGTAALGDSANATAALAKVAPERFVADMRAGLDEIAKRTPGVKLGAIGFCFGGGMSWRLVASKDPRLAAIAPFYGRIPDDADFVGSKAAVLGIFAERDARVNASRDSAKAALDKAGLTSEILTLPEADHAFFNDTGPRYAPEAAAKAWAKVLEWFGRHVG